MKEIDCTAAPMTNFDRAIAAKRAFRAVTGAHAAAKGGAK